MRLLRWLSGLVEDPVSHDASSARVVAMLCGVVGCVVAIQHPEHPATVAALIGGGAVAIITRTKTDNDDA